MSDESRNSATLPATPVALLEGASDAPSTLASPKKPRSRAPAKSRAPKSVTAMKTSRAKPEVAKAEEATKEAAKPRAKKAPSKAPRSRRAPASKAADSTPSPVSVDLRATLFSGPGQDEAFASARAVASARAGEKLREDEISIPPAALDPLEPEERDRMIANAQRVVRGQASSDDAEIGLPARRKGWSSGFTRLAVGVAAAACLLGVMKVRSSRANHAAPPIAAAAQVAEEAAPALPPVPVVEEPTAPAAPTKSATEEREAARDLLEHGKSADAIEAAARSVAIDPTDAEAWLLLGAAHQAANHWTEAHDAFTSCTKQAKTGNVYECGAMLQYNGPR